MPGLFVLGKYPLPASPWQGEGRIEVQAKAKLRVYFTGDLAVM